MIGLIKAPHGLRSLRRAQGGSSVVQFALIVPLFILTFVAFVEFGRAIYTSSTLDNAVREAVRVAIVRGAASGSIATADDIRAVVRGKATAVDTSAMTINVTYSPDNKPGSTVTVQATLSYAFTMPVLNLVGPIQFARSASMIIAN